MKNNLRSLFCLLSFFALAGVAPADTITWINTAGGNWSEPLNWSPNQVPADSDTAVITAGGNYTVTLDVDATVTGLVLGAPGGSTKQTLSINGQVLTLNPDGFLTIATNGVLTISTGSTLTLYGALTNAGTVNWTGGGLEIYNYNGNGGYIGGINNLSGAVFNVQSDQTVTSGGYGYEYFNNAGLIHKSSSTGTTALNVFFDNTGAVEVDSGTVLISGDGIGTALESGSQLTGGGTVLFNSGTLTLNGATTSSNLLVAGGALGGSGVMSGTMTWTGGSLNPGNTLTIATNGVLTISEGSGLGLYGALTNAGTVNWVGSGIEIYNYNGNGSYIGGINNLAGAVFNIQSDQAITCACYGYEYFNNAGLVRKSASTGATAINVLFNNSGTLDVASGTVSLDGAGTGSGRLIAEAGTTLAMADGYVASSDEVFSGAGTNLWTGGDITINGLVATTNTVLAGAGLDGNGSFSGHLTWTSGLINPGGTLTIATNGVWNLNGSDSVLALYGALTNVGTVNWVGGGLEIINYNGNNNWTGGINNQAGAVFNIQSDQTISCACYGYEYFNNAGLVRKSSSTGVTVIGVPFNNTGTMDVASGTVNLSGAGAGSGQFIADAGATLAVAGGYDASGGDVFGGAGTNLWTGGTVTIDGSVTTANSVLSGASLGGNASFSSQLTWTSGTIGPGGALTIATNGVWNLNGSGGTLNLYGALTNAGTVNWVGGGLEIINYNGNNGWTGGINNLAGAVFNVQSDQTMACACYGYEYFDNAGLVRKAQTTGTTTIGVPLVNTGTVDVESGTVSLTSADSLSGGILNFGIISVTNFGSLNFPGAASLDGALTVHINPGYVPAASNTFALVTYGSAAGVFTGLNLPTDLNWQTNYSSTNFTVTAGFPQSALGWLNLGYTTNGAYTIDPSGSAPFTINTLMTVAGGGWTELTGPVAASILNTNAGTPRAYLYLKTGTSLYYRTPLSGLVWNWNSGQDLYGTYYYSGASGESNFQVTASSEHSAYGVGGSSGPGTTYKCLVTESSCLNSNGAQVQLCQDLPGIFGGGCQCGVTVYIRENGTLTPPAAPAIIVQPVNQQALPGATAQFNVTAAGAVPLKYQWAFNQTNQLAAATNATLTLNNVSNNLVGSYSVVITNAYGSATSTVATLTLLQFTPTITWTNPAAIPYATALGAAQLNATSSVPGVLVYNPPLGTVFNAGPETLSVMFTPTDTVDYSSATASVTLNVTPAPLTVKANNASRVYGQANPAFSGTLTGVINGDNLTATYSCSAVSFSAPGHYPIVPGIVDPNGRLGNYSLTSSNGTLTVTAGAPPTFTGISPNSGLTNGGTPVTITGTGFELGATVAFAGQSASNVVVTSGTQITAVTPPGPLGAVKVLATNPDATAITLTNGFTYTGTPPTILTPPASQLLAQSSNAVFSVSALYAASYQWQFDGGNLTDNGRITGSHSAVLTVPGVQPADAGTYQVIITNVWGSANASATLAVVVAPAIVTPPQNQTVGMGGTVSFTAGVSGTAPFTYQWLVGGVPLPGQTNSTLTLASVPSSDQGHQYSVVVGNLAGSATSTAATLTVLNYCASVQPSQSVYPMGSTVPLTVQTVNCSSQAAVPNSSATVWISQGGTIRSLPVTTGPSGSATVNFVPLPTEVGTYQVAAALPGQPVPAAQGTFSLVGMSLSQSIFNAALTPGIPVTNTITLTNLTGTALTGITASKVGSTPDVQVTISAPATVAGNGTSSLTFVMLAPGNNAAQDSFDLQLNTTQGTINFIAVTATVTPTYPQLATTPFSLSASMVAGGQTLVNFYVVNTGGLTSGPVQVLLPSASWLSTVTTLPLPPIAPGQSNQVTLALTPPANLPLGAYPGTLELTSADADLAVPFQFNCVSALTGSLQVTVQDELSSYGTGSPNVSNATVHVTDFLTGALVTNVVTGATGTVLFNNLTSAYYTVAITAPDHGSFGTTVLVAPSQTNNLTAFISLQLVDYTWVVTPTIIPDHYTFTLDTTFATEVPWPVVSVSPGAIDLCGMQGQSNQINLTITNSGLIAASGLNLYFGTHPDWSIVPLASSLGDLAPQSSLVVPVLITALGSATTVPDSITAQLGYSVVTPTQTYNALVPIYVYDANPLDCEPQSPTPAPVVTVCTTCGGSAGGGLGGGGAGGGLGGGTGGIPPTIQSPNYTFETPQGALVQVKLQIQQSAVIARDAFNASLQLVNSAGSTISNLSASITVYDASNNVANGLFGLPAPTLSGLNAVNGTGVLANGATGSAAWTIVPATNAAPTVPVQFSVGGSFSYILNGEPVTIPLFPVPITVLPTPILDVDYFLQHDVYSDDPFTPQIEPSIPFPLGILVKNIGYGNAYDFSITSAQPQIIQNSNNLLIAFQLIGSQAGTNQSLSPSFTLDLGDIGPLGSSEGLWYMTSTLEGQFISFAAAYEHTDDFGNTNTTLINRVKIHEMNHVVELTQPVDDGLPDFLVNDTTNVDALPGIVYSSDGTTYPVTSLTSAVTSGVLSSVNSNITVTVSAPAGRVYLEVVDPSGGNNPIASVTRSDGVHLLVGPNVWQTPARTHMVPPKPNNLIHIFDYNSTGSYTVTYGLPVTAPAVTTLSAANVMPTSATLNATVNPDSANTDVYFQWGTTTNYGNNTATTTLNESLNLTQPVAVAIWGLRPNSTNHFRAVGINSAGTTLGADLPLITPPLPPPVITQVSNQVMAVGQALIISNQVTVATAPALFSLTGSDPAGSSISTNGVFRWTPACEQGSSTNLITIRVTDSSSPPLSTLMTFTVAVGECVQVELGNTVMQVGKTNGVSVTLMSSVALTNLSWTVAAPAGAFTNWVFAASNPAIAHVSSTQTYFSLSTTAGQSLQSPTLLGTISIKALPGPSAFLFLAASNILGAAVDGSMVGNIASGPGRVVVIGAQPLLEPLLGANSTRTLVLYDNPGTNYQLKIYTDLSRTNWQNGGTGMVTNMTQTFNVDPTVPVLFYRAQ